jgi:hypothetical protein
MKKRDLIPNTTLAIEAGHCRIKFVILSFDFKKLDSERASLKSLRKILEKNFAAILS